jgi:hypothetical protein
MEVLDQKWIRVSSILSMIPSFGSDGKWGFPLQHLDQEMLQRKADLGTAVHAAISTHINGGFPVLSAREVGYFDSFLKWEHEVDLVCLNTERRFFFEPMNLTGMVDMIGKVSPNGPYHIIDFKCTVSADHVKWPLQGAFYAFLAQVNGISLDEKCLFVQLDAHGSLPKVHPYVITKEMSNMALSLYNLYIHLTKS